MAYSTSTPPLLVGDQPIAGPKRWRYASTELPIVMCSSVHITNGLDLGMKIGDLVDYIATSVAGSVSASDAIFTSILRVTRVLSTSVNLSTGVITSSST